MQQETRKIFSLHAILNRVQQVFDELMLGKYFWVKVEVLKVNKDRRGHYYLELVEQVDDQVLAKCRATIWSRNVERCVIDGGDDLEKVVKAGAEILCYGEAIFHPVFGFSLHVIHVDYAFSLGEIERKKQQTLLELQRENLLEANKKITPAVVIQKIAVVASMGTSGYEDFVQHLRQNPHRFSFTLDCYDTQVQGEGAVRSICKQLTLIAQKNYDAIVVIRGGGSKFDLDAFNAKEVAVKIAQMPFAVFTGIGHETDSTVADYVAHTYFKTPSAVAAYIVALAFGFDVFLNQAVRTVQEQTRRIVEQNQSRLAQLEENVGRLSKFRLSDSRATLEAQTKELSYVVKKVNQQSTSELRLMKLTVITEVNRLRKQEVNRLLDTSMLMDLWIKQRLLMERQKIKSVQEMILTRVKHKVEQARGQLKQSQEILTLYDLEQLLKRGFAIIRLQGKILDESTVLEKGDKLEVILYNKQYKITIGHIEEIEQWKNLLMKAQQLS